MRFHSVTTSTAAGKIPKGLFTAALSSLSTRSSTGRIPAGGSTRLLAALRLIAVENTVLYRTVLYELHGSWTCIVPCQAVAE